MERYSIINLDTGRTEIFDADEIDWITQAVVQDKARMSIDKEWDSLLYKEENVKNIIDKLHFVSTHC